MSLPTYSSARDEILGLLLAAWNANAPAFNGGVAPPIAWPGVEVGPVPVDGPSARVFLRLVSARQATLGNLGARRFLRSGLVTVQIFAPTSLVGGLSQVENLATIARDAYEGVGTASGIWFRNVRIQEVGPSDGLHQTNVVAEFEYDELK